MELAQRNEQIYRLREKGVTLARIGEKFGISHQRVSKIYRQTRQEKQIRRISPFQALLSTRSRNGLVKYFHDAAVLDNPARISEEGAARLRVAYQIGAKSLREIAEALQQVGVVADADQWLTSSVKKRRTPPTQRLSYQNKTA